MTKDTITKLREIRGHLNALTELLNTPSPIEEDKEFLITHLARWFRTNKHRFPEDLFLECTAAVATLTKDTDVCFLPLCEHTPEQIERLSGTLPG